MRACMRRLAALALAATLLPLPAAAETLSDVVAATLRPGWRQADGTHVAALHLKLAPGWKTYWRAPGDAGIPPEFDWSGSSNMGAMSVTWPAPHVFHRTGMRSLGYSGDVVLPIVVSAQDGGEAVRSAARSDRRLRGRLHAATLRVNGTLPAGATTPDPVIAAALADRPFTEAEAGVGAVRCSISPGRTGPAWACAPRSRCRGSGRRGDAIIETGNPAIWVAEPEAARAGGTLDRRDPARARGRQGLRARPLRGADHRARRGSGRGHPRLPTG